MALESWYADDYLISQGIVRNIEDKTGHRQRTALRGDAVYAAQQHGELWRRRQLDAGEVVLNMWLYDTTQAAVDQWWDELLRALTPQHRLVRLHVTRADGAQRECFAYLQEPIQPQWSGPLGLRCGFAMHIPSGRWRDIADSTVVSAPGSGGAPPLGFTGIPGEASSMPGTLMPGSYDQSLAQSSGVLPKTVPLTPFAGATAPMDDLVYRIDGPIAGGGVQFLSDIDGSVIEAFTYGLAVADGQWVTINAGDWSVLGGGGHVADPSQLLYTGSRYLTVGQARPGYVPTVRLTGSNAGAHTKLTVTGRAQYTS